MTTIDSMVMITGAEFERLRAEVDRLRAALEAAAHGLERGVKQYALLSWTGQPISGDEQYPWVRAMMVGLDAARATLTEQKEKE